MTPRKIETSAILPLAGGFKVHEDWGSTPAAIDAWAVKFEAWRKGAEPKDAKRVLDQPAKKRKSITVPVRWCVTRTVASTGARGCSC